MRNAILLLVLVMVPMTQAVAGGTKVKLAHVKVDLQDKNSLQRGARIFVNYCLSCHSAGYMRYNRVARDLGVSDDLIKQSMVFITDDQGVLKTGSLMKAVMPAEEAKRAFNTVPPDLTLVARSRASGANWLYTYMRSFYRDPDSVSGWNNIVFPNVAMPHVLYEWQGEQRAIFETDADGGKHFKKFELIKPGTLQQAEYDLAMQDLTNFLVYMGEPAKLVRYRIGAYVIAFLLVLLFFVYLLKREYWKDVH